MSREPFKGSFLKIALHLLAWSVFLLIPLFVSARWEVGRDFFWFYYINTVISGIIFYLNYQFLVPKLFLNSKKGRYYLSVFFLLGLFYFVSDTSNKLVLKNFGSEKNTEESVREGQIKEKVLPPGGGMTLVRPSPPYKAKHILNFGFTSFFLVFLSLGIRVLERHAEIEKLQKELEKEKLNSELAFLKNQVSPHFFFNTMNNIYSLTGVNTASAQNAILKLSKLMRYLLYESDQSNNSLGKEIEFMNNYIDLMKLRLSDKVSLDVSFPDYVEGIIVPPLLFIPFIENAFKHGISYREKSFILIKLSLIKGELIFNCANSRPENVEEIGLNHSGIGLENVRQRLSLIFPEKHDLRINVTDSVYEVILKLTLN